MIAAALHKALSDAIYDFQGISGDSFRHGLYYVNDYSEGERRDDSSLIRITDIDLARKTVTFNSISDRSSRRPDTLWVPRQNEPARPLSAFERSVVDKLCWRPPRIVTLDELD